MPKLTQCSVTALPVEPKDYFVWDATLAGFGVRVLPSGVKTYQVQYRKGRWTRRAALGRHGTITTEEARTIARGMLGQVAGGLDPVEEIALERMSVLRRRANTSANSGLQSQADSPSIRSTRCRD